MIKQIVMVGILGLALVLVTSAVLTIQYASASATSSASHTGGSGSASGGNGAHGGTSVPPIVSCTGATELHNPNCPPAG